MFSAPWCGGCKVMKPIVEEIGGIEIINVDDYGELVEKYKIMSLPTFVLDDGVEIKMKYGSMPKNILEDFFNDGQCKPL